MINPEVIRIATDRKRELLGNLVENLDFTDSAGIISSEGSILKRCELMQIMYVFLGDPEFVLEYGFSKDQVEKGERFEFDSKYRDSIRNRSIAAAAETLNISPEAFEDPSKFTPEMQSAFNAALDGITANRVSCYLFCFYNLALSAIHHYNVRMQKPPESAKTGVDLRQAAVSYFFALNPQVNPFTVIHEGETFSEDFSKGVIEIYEKICEFYYSHDKIDSTRKLLRAFSKDASTREPSQGLGRVKPRNEIFSSSVVHGIPKVNTIGKLDKLSNSMVVGDIRYLSDAMKSLGDAYSLFSYSLSLFAQANKHSSKTLILRVYADTRDFARASGYSVDPQKKDSPEEQKKENIRAHNELMNFVKKLKRNAETLLSTSATFSANLRGKGATYSGLNLIGGYKITSDSAMIEFTQSAAEYFVRLPVGYFSGKQFLIESRRTSALAIYDKMAEHCSMINNVLQGRENILKIASFLACASYPSIDECKEHGWSWEIRIKERFENDLEYLYRMELIAPAVYKEKTGERISGGYFYCGKNGTPIDAAHQFSCFEEFSNCNLYFELADFAPHADRVKEIRAKQAEAKKKQQKRAQRKKENHAPEAPADTSSETSSES